MAENPRIDELKRRVQSDPASIAFAALAEEYRRAGQYEEAIATCQAGLQRHPAYLSAHVTLGRALLEVNRFDEARQELEYVLKIAPENLAAIRGLAEIHHRRGEGPDEHHYQAALAAHREASAAPAAAPAAPPAAPKPVAAAKVVGGVPKPVAAAAKPVVEAPKPAVTAAKPVVEAPKPVVVAAKPAVEAPKPAAAAAAPAVTMKPAVPPVRVSQNVPAAPKTDPSLPKLEAFLAAIVRARQELEAAASDVR